MVVGTPTVGNPDCGRKKVTRRRGWKKVDQAGLQPLEKFMHPTTRSQSSKLRRQQVESRARERIPVRVVMVIEGEVNVLLRQPETGPWYKSS